VGAEPRVSAVPLTGQEEVRAKNSSSNSPCARHFILRRQFGIESCRARGSLMGYMAFDAPGPPVLALALVIGFSLITNSYTADVHTTDGEVLTNASVTGFTADGVTIMHSSGIGTYDWTSIAAGDREKIGYTSYLHQQEANSQRVAAAAQEEKNKREEITRRGEAFVEETKAKLLSGGLSSMGDVVNVMRTAIEVYGFDLLQFATALYGPPTDKFGPESGSTENPITGRVLPHVDTDFIFSDGFYDGTVQKRVRICLKVRMGINLDGKTRESFFIGEPFASSFYLVFERTR